MAPPSLLTCISSIKVVCEGPQVLGAEEEVPVCLAAVLDGPRHVSYMHKQQHIGGGGGAWLWAWGFEGTGNLSQKTSCHQNLTTSHV